MGAKRYHQLWVVTKRTNIYNLIICLILIVFGILFYKQLGLLFSKDTLVLSTFYSIFILVLISQPVNSLGFTLDAIFKGLGEMKFLRNVLIGSTLFGFIPAIFIGNYFNLKLIGVWIAIVIWVAFRAVALMIKFKRKYYTLAKNEMVSNQSPFA